jgi:hypothetical protein
VKTQRKNYYEFSDARNGDNGAAVVAAVPVERDANGRGAAEDRDSRRSERRERLRGEMGGPELSAARGRRDPGARAAYERPLRRGLGRHRRGGGGGRAVPAEAGARIRRFHVHQGQRPGAASGGGSNSLQDPHRQGPRHEGAPLPRGGAPRVEHCNHGQPRLRRLPPRHQGPARQRQRLLRAPLRLPRRRRSLPRREGCRKGCSGGGAGVP